MWAKEKLKELQEERMQEIRQYERIISDNDGEYLPSSVIWEREGKDAAGDQELRVNHDKCYQRQERISC